MLRLARSTVAAGMAVFALGSCGGDATGTDADALVGVYTLVTIDGQPLPVIVDQVGNDFAEITAGVVTLDADHSFDDVTDLRFTVTGNVTTETDATTGTWSLNGSTVQFAPTDGSANYTMTWDGQDRISQLFRPDPTLPGFVLVYTR